MCFGHGTPEGKGGPCAPGGACHGGGNRAVTSQPRTGQSTSVVRRCEILVRGGRRVGQEGVRDRGAQERQQTRGEATQTHRTRAKPGGTRASTADKEEGHSKAGEATRRGNQNSGNREPEWSGWGSAWEAATIKGRLGQPAPSLPGARATPAQPASDGGCLPQPRWAVCATGAGAHQGQTSREGAEDIWWTAGTARGGTGHLGLTHTETQRGR